MTVDELKEKLEDAQSWGMGDRQVIIPSDVGLSGSVSVTDVEAEVDDTLVRLS